MPFMGRPNVTDTERRRMEGFLDAYGSKHLLLMAIKQILKKSDIKKSVVPPSKPDTNFDKWQKKNRGM
jgi:hypothetical protein